MSMQCLISDQDFVSSTLYEKNFHNGQIKLHKDLSFQSRAATLKKEFLLSDI